MRISMKLSFFNVASWCLFLLPRTSGNADFVFVVDTTKTMEPRIVLLKAAITNIVTSISGLGSGPNRYGLVSFEDYRLVPWGDPGSGDEPYRQELDLTTSTAAFITAVNDLVTRDGETQKGSQLVAIRQLLAGTAQTVNGYVLSQNRMTFRSTAQKIIVMFTDSGFHAPEVFGSLDYPGPMFSTVIAQLQNSSVTPRYQFIGLNAGGVNGGTPQATADLIRLANATNSFASGGAIDCGGVGPDISNGGSLVCTQVAEGSAATIETAFVNLIAEVVVTTAPPTSTPNPNPTELCLSSRNTVTEKTRGVIPLDTLRIGDFVETSQPGVFHRVFSFAHHSQDTQAEYLQIYTSKSSLPLEITKDHLLFVNGRPRRASQVELGDRLGDDGHYVTHIASVQRRGLYAPLTESGTLLLNGGIPVSSYVAVWEWTAWNQHTLGQMVMAPVRTVCRLMPSYCAAETYDAETGYSQLWYGPILFRIIAQVQAWGPVASYLVSALVVVPVCGVLWIVEQATLLLLYVMCDESCCGSRRALGAGAIGMVTLRIHRRLSPK